MKHPPKASPTPKHALVPTAPTAVIPYSEMWNADDGAMVVAPGAARPGDAEAREIESAAAAFNTKRAYQSAWRSYVEWCSSIGADPLGQGMGMGDYADQVRRYLAMRRSKGRKLNSIRMDLTVVNQARVSAGLEGPRGHPVLERFMTGLRRHVAKNKQDAVRKMAAISPDILRSMLNALPPTLHGVRNHALLALGFFCGMRRSELCELTVADVTLGDDGSAAIKITHSKTDQEWRGRTLEVGALPDDAFMCPARALHRWHQAAGLRAAEAPFFCGIRPGDKLSPLALTGEDVRRIILASMRHAGIDATGFSGHSLRSGFVTSARQAGASFSDIMAVTGHTTEEMVQSYFRRSKVAPSLAQLMTKKVPP